MDRVKQYQTWRFLALLGAVICTCIAVLGIQFVGVETDVVKGLSSDSETLERYNDFQARFELGRADETLLLRAEDLANPDTFAALENLILDLHFVDGVAEVLSLFSVTGDMSTTPLIFTQSDAPIAGQFDEMYAVSPAARGLVSSDRSTALVHVIAERGVGPGELAKALSDIATSSPEIETQLVGQSAVERKIAANLIRDQMIVTPLAIVLCILTGFVVLRSVRAIVVCAIPAICSVLWFLGVLGWAGQSLDPWLATLPTLVMVLTFADSLHLFYAVCVPGQCLERAMRQVLPAAFLTSLTSALALASFAATGTDALIGLAIWGPVSMLCGFTAVALLFPLLARALMHGKVAEPVQFVRVIKFAGHTLVRPKTMTCLAFVVLVSLMPTLNRAVPSFSIAEHIRSNSPLGLDLAYMESKGLGSASLFVEVEDKDGIPGWSEQDYERLATVAALTVGAPVQTLSDTPSVPERFRAEDGLSTVIPIPLPLKTHGAHLGAKLDGLRQDLASAGLEDVTQVTGQTLLAHQAVPETVNTMRLSFYIALSALVVVVGVSQKSLRLALLATGFSALPMLAIEAVLVIFGIGMSIAVAFALVVAFGIAVDDTIHFLNRRRIAGGCEAHRLNTALSSAGPPMIASTLVMSFGFLSTLFGAVASLPVFGLFVIFALLFALMIDLLLLPSLILISTR